MIATAILLLAANQSKLPAFPPKGTWQEYRVYVREMNAVGLPRTTVANFEKAIRSDPENIALRIGHSLASTDSVLYQRFGSNADKTGNKTVDSSLASESLAMVAYKATSDIGCALATVRDYPELKIEHSRKFYQKKNQQPKFLVLSPQDAIALKSRAMSFLLLKLASDREVMYLDFFRRANKLSAAERLRVVKGILTSGKGPFAIERVLTSLISVERVLHSPELPGHEKMLLNIYAEQPESVYVRSAMSQLKLAVNK